MPWQRDKDFIILQTVPPGDIISHGLPFEDTGKMARRRERLAETTLPQDQSPFFNKLPGEVRTQIYSHMWRTGGYSGGVHIELGDAWGSSHSVWSYPCVVDAHCSAERNEKLDQLWERHQQDVESGARRKSDIMMLDKSFPKLHAVQHWECYEPKRIEELTGRRLKRWAPFLPVLLTCKRFYLECIDNLFQTVDFHFYHNAEDTAFRFLISRVPPYLLGNLRSMHLTLVRWSPERYAGKFFQYPVCTTETVLQELHIWLEGLPKSGQTVTQKDILKLVGPSFAPKVTLHLPTPPAEFCRSCYAGGSYELNEGPMKVARYELPRYKFRVFSTMSKAAQTYGYAPLKIRDTCSMCVQHPRRF